MSKIHCIYFIVALICLSVAMVVVDYDVQISRNADFSLLSWGHHYLHMFFLALVFVTIGALISYFRIFYFGNFTIFLLIMIFSGIVCLVACTSNTVLLIYFALFYFLFFHAYLAPRMRKATPRIC